LKPYSKYKALGIEWLERAPEQWGIKKLKYVAKLRSGESITSDDIRPSGEYPVYGGNGLRGYSDKFTHEGEYVLIGRQGALCGNVNYASGKFWASEHAVVALPLAEVSTYWLGELLRSMNLNQYNQAAAQPGLSVERIENLSIPFPNYSEQVSIATFLDDKTKQIDTLIEKKRKLIGLLKEERQAVINHAVTKGLDPKAKMKPSGIEWLGDVPESWEVGSLTKYLESIVDYRGRTPEKIEQGIFLVTARNIKGGRIDYSLSEEYVSPEQSAMFMQRGSLKSGDILFTMEAPLGEVANVDRTEICLAQRVVKFRGLPARLDNYFGKYVIMSDGFQFQLQSNATGSTALGLKSSKLNLLKIALPPLSEQRLITRFIDNRTNQIETLIEKAERGIELLTEYRTALITDVVTGKVDVSVTT
jgi:type I restriction enzyme S subunit